MRAPPPARRSPPPRRLRGADSRRARTRASGSTVPARSAGSARPLDAAPPVGSTPWRRTLAPGRREDLGRSRGPVAHLLGGQQPAAARPGLAEHHSLSPGSAGRDSARRRGGELTGQQPGARRGPGRGGRGRRADADATACPLRFRRPGGHRAYPGNRRPLRPRVRPRCAASRPASRPRPVPTDRASPPSPLGHSGMQRGDVYQPSGAWPAVPEKLEPSAGAATRQCRPWPRSSTSSRPSRAVAMATGSPKGHGEL